MAVPMGLSAVFYFSLCTPVMAEHPQENSIPDEKQDEKPPEKKPDEEVPKDPASPDTVTDPVWIPLLDSELEKRWKSILSDAAVPLADVWKITRESPEAEPVLVCVGKPKGFLLTLEQYSDFEMTLEWRIPTDENGNSGVLVYAQDEPRIWPTAIQVQFHQPKAGSIFPSGDAKSDNTSDSDLARPVGNWNECRILSQKGRLSVDINGKKAGEITGAVPANGHIALQSEGAEVHFRRVRIRKLPAATPETTEQATSNTPPPPM